jgi:hypothetical protein
MGVIAYWAHSSFLIFLVQDGTHCVLRCIYLHHEGLHIIRSMQNWIAGNYVDEFVQCLRALICPFEFLLLLQELCKWLCQMRESRNKGPLIPKYSQGASDLLYRGQLSWPCRESILLCEVNLYGPLADYDS